MKHLLPLIIFAALWLSACRDDIIVDNTPENVFLTFWTILDKNYPYFIERGIDWDSVYTACYPRAKAARSDEELAVVLTEIIRRIDDRHLNITTFDSAIGSIYPKQTDTFYHGYCHVYEYGFHRYAYSYPANFYSDTIKKIGYVSIFSFLDRRPLEVFNMKQFGKSLYIPNHENGVIIDIRDSGGGSGYIMREVISHFFENERIIFYASYKTGKGHNDFGKKEAVYQKGKGTLPESVPILLLTGKRAYSAGNLFAYIMNDLPNVTLMGEPSGGGGSTVNEVLLPNNWKLRYPYMKTFSSTGANMEFGIEPDIYMARQTADFDTIENKDPLIVRAIEILDSINGI